MENNYKTVRHYKRLSEKYYRDNYQGKKPAYKYFSFILKNIDLLDDFRIFSDLSLNYGYNPIEFGIDTINTIVPKNNRLYLYLTGGERQKTPMTRENLINLIKICKEHGLHNL